MADAMPLDPDKNACRDVLGIPHDTHCLALLPGSRGAEVEMLSADFLKTAQLLRQTYPDLEDRGAAGECQTPREVPMHQS